MRENRPIIYRVKRKYICIIERSFTLKEKKEKRKKCSKNRIPSLDRARGLFFNTLCKPCVCCELACLHVLCLIYTFEEGLYTPSSCLCLVGLLCCSIHAGGSGGKKRERIVRVSSSSESSWPLYIYYIKVGLLYYYCIHLSIHQKIPPAVNFCECVKN